MTKLERVTVPSLKDRVSAAEWQARVDLAACYRLVHLEGWTHQTANHISARVPGEDGAFLINPYGLYYEHVTASNLVKIDCDGNLLSDTPHKVNRAGFVIHSAVHAARHDVACVLHTHTDVGTAISATRAGLLPVSQDACLFYNRVAYHAFEGIASDLAERERLVRDLGAHMVMILRNHGLLSCGRTVAEAFFLMWRLEKACRIQMMLMNARADLALIPHDLAEKTANSFPWIRAGTAAGEMDWPNLIARVEAHDPGYKN